MSEAIGLVVRDGEERVFALPPGFTASEHGLVVADGVDWDAYARVGTLLSSMVNWTAHSLPWLLGDFVSAGERIFPERVHQAVELTGWATDTVMNYVRAAQRVPPENRVLRGGVLPIRYGMDLALVPPPEQPRMLKRIENEGLSAREAHRMMRGKPDYKRAAVPERATNKHDRIKSAFPRVYSTNETRLRSAPLDEACRFLWELCVSMYEEVDKPPFEKGRWRRQRKVTRRGKEENWKENDA
jgi:hypothetical protein